MALADDNRRLTSRYCFTKSWHSMIELHPRSQVSGYPAFLISLRPISIQWCDLYLKFYKRPTSLCLHPVKLRLISVSVTTSWHLLRTIPHTFQQNTPDYKSNFTFCVLYYYVFRSNKTCYVLGKERFWGCVKAVTSKSSFVIFILNTPESFPLPNLTEMKRDSPASHPSPASPNKEDIHRDQLSPSELRSMWPGPFSNHELSARVECNF